MEVLKQNGRIVISTADYTLTLAPLPKPSLLLDKRTNRYFGFVAAGDCLKVDAADAATATGEWQVSESAGAVICTREEQSTLWSKKTFCVVADEDSIEFYHQITGEGAIDEIRYFRHCYNGKEYGFAGDIDEIFSAAPNFREQSWFHPARQVIINYGNELSMNTGAHAMASVPHVMGLHDRRDATQVGVGVFARTGEYLWDEFVWNPEAKIPPTPYEGDSSKAGGFAIRYFGKKEIEGDWRSPSLIFTFPKNVEATLSCALDNAYQKQYLPKPQAKNVPSWWREPIYCTWSDQTTMGRMTKQPAGKFCTEELTDRWLNKLLEHNIKPGIVILDDKWQQSKYTGRPDLTKWPDLRGWIDKCHNQGIKVFLWGLAWYNEDIPLEEAVTRDGQIVCGDVTNPVFEAKLREKIHFFFSDEPGCLNADGVKIDGQLGLPVGKGLKNHKNIWGLELQRYYLKVVYEAAKAAKADACISTFSANPYLDEYTDMVRLGDMFVNRLNTAESMKLRKSVFAVTHPGAIVDTDGQWEFSIGDDYMDMLDIQAEIGVPCIYNAEYINRMRYFFDSECRTLTDAEYEKIAAVFARYRQSL